eukprot:TRINITY_DN76519_c0_g1_i1.p1 TRINITY_DN76519_c0_g1~~TRINITY_DN76519_c0_g1_i1.p1  ORF type:complete len:181 (+),score=30.46 TRINITY_DN76519_c0_g1_i1:73-615(+)
MNGLSFAEFENASFDSLHDRGFAGMKDLHEATKNMKPGDFAMRIDNGQPTAMISRPSYSQGGALAGGSGGYAMPALPSGSGGGYASSNMQQQPPTVGRQTGIVPGQQVTGFQQPLPTTSAGVMSGNSRPTNAWVPSREADARVRNQDARPLPASAPTQLGAPAVAAGSGQRGTFVGWKSN